MRRRIVAFALHVVDVDVDRIVVRRAKLLDLRAVVLSIGTEVTGERHVSTEDRVVDVQGVGTIVVAAVLIVDVRVVSIRFVSGEDAEVDAVRGVEEVVARAIRSQRLQGVNVGATSIELNVRAMRRFSIGDKRAVQVNVDAVFVILLCDLDRRTARANGVLFAVVDEGGVIVQGVLIDEPVDLRGSLVHRNVEVVVGHAVVVDVLSILSCVSRAAFFSDVLVGIPFRNEPIVARISEGSADMLKVVAVVNLKVEPDLVTGTVGADRTVAAKRGDVSVQVRRLIHSTVLKVNDFDRHAGSHVYDARIDRVDTQVTDPRPSVVVTGLRNGRANDVTAGRIAVLQNVLRAVAFLPCVVKSVLVASDQAGVGVSDLEVIAVRIFHRAILIAVSYERSDQHVVRGIVVGFADANVRAFVISDEHRGAVRDLVVDVRIGAIQIIERSGVQVVLHADVLRARSQGRVRDTGLAADFYVGAVFIRFRARRVAVSDDGSIIDVIDDVADLVRYVLAAYGRDVVVHTGFGRSVNRVIATLIGDVDRPRALIVKEVEIRVATVDRDHNGTRPSFVVGAARVRRRDRVGTGVLDLIRITAYVTAGVGERNRNIIIRQVDHACRIGEVFVAACRCDVIRRGIAGRIGPSIATGKAQVVFQGCLIHHDGSRLIRFGNTGDLVVVEHAGRTEVVRVDREDVGARIDKGRISATLGDGGRQRAGIVAEESKARGDGRGLIGAVVIVAVTVADPSNTRDGVLSDGRRGSKHLFTFDRRSGDAVINEELFPIRLGDQATTRSCRISTGVFVNGVAYRVAGRTKHARYDNDLIGTTRISRAVIAKEADGHLYRLRVTVVSYGDAAPDGRGAKRGDRRVRNIKQFIIAGVRAAEHEGRALTGANVAIAVGSGGGNFVTLDQTVAGGDHQNLRRRTVVRLGQRRSKAQRLGCDRPMASIGFGGNFIVCVAAHDAGRVITRDRARFIGVREGNGVTEANLAVRRVAKRCLHRRDNGHFVLFAVVHEVGKLGVVRSRAAVVGPLPGDVDLLLRDRDLKAHKVTDRVPRAGILAFDQNVSAVFVLVRSVFILNVEGAPYVVVCKSAVVIRLTGDVRSVHARVCVEEGDLVACGRAALLRAAVQDEPPIEGQHFALNKALDGRDLTLRRSEVRTGPVCRVVPSNGQGRGSDGERLRGVRVREVVIGIGSRIDDRGVLIRVQEADHRAVLLEVDSVGQVHGANRSGACEGRRNGGAAIVAVVHVATERIPSDGRYRIRVDGQARGFNEGDEVIVRDDRRDGVGAGAHDAVFHIRPTGQVGKVEGRVRTRRVVIDHRQVLRIDGRCATRDVVIRIRGSLDREGIACRRGNAGRRARCDEVQIPRRTVKVVRAVVQVEESVRTARIIDVSGIDDPRLAVCRAGGKDIVARCVAAHRKADDLRGLCGDRTCHAVDVRRGVGKAVGRSIVDRDRVLGGEDRSIRSEVRKDALLRPVVSKLRNATGEGKSRTAEIRPIDRNFDRRDRDRRGQSRVAGQRNVVVARTDRRGNQSTGDHAAAEEHVLCAVLAIVAVSDASVFAADRVSHGDLVAVLRNGGGDGDQMLLSVVDVTCIRKGQAGDRRLVDRQSRGIKGIAGRHATVSGDQRVVGVGDIHNFHRVNTRVDRTVTAHAVDRVRETERIGAVTKVGSTGDGNRMRLIVVGVFSANEGQTADRSLINDPRLRISLIEHVVVGQVAFQAHARRSRGCSARNGNAAAVHQYVDCRSVLVIDGDITRIVGLTDLRAVLVVVGKRGGVELHALRLTVVRELRNAVVKRKRSAAEVRPRSRTNGDCRDHEGLGVTTRQVVVGGKIIAVIRKRDGHRIGAYVFCSELIDFYARASGNVGIGGVKGQGFSADNAAQAKSETVKGSGVVDPVVSIRRNRVSNGQRHVLRRDLVFTRKSQAVVVIARSNDRFRVVRHCVLNVRSGDRFGASAIAIEGIRHADIVTILRLARFVLVCNGNVGSAAVAVVLAAAVRQRHVCDGRGSDRQRRGQRVVAGQGNVVVAGGQFHLSIVGACVHRICNRLGIRIVGIVSKGRGKGVVVASQAFAVGVGDGQRFHRLIVSGGHVGRADIVVGNDVRLTDREGLHQHRIIGEDVVLIIQRRKGDTVRSHGVAYDPNVDGSIRCRTRRCGKGRAAVRFNVCGISEVDRIAGDDIAVGDRYGITVRRLVVSCVAAAYRRPSKVQSALADRKSRGSRAIDLVVVRRVILKRHRHAVRTVIFEAVRSVSQIESIACDTAGDDYRGQGPILTVVRCGKGRTGAACRIRRGIGVVLRRPTESDYSTIDGQGRGQHTVVVVAASGSNDQNLISTGVYGARKRIVTRYVGVTIISNHFIAAEHIRARRRFDILIVSDRRRRAASIFKRVVLRITAHAVDAIVAVAHVERKQRKVIGLGLIAQREIGDLRFGDRKRNRSSFDRNVVDTGKYCIHTIDACINARRRSCDPNQVITQVTGSIVFLAPIEVHAVIRYVTAFLIQHVIVISIIDHAIDLIIEASRRTIKDGRMFYRIVGDGRIDRYYDIIRSVINGRRSDLPNIITHTCVKLIVGSACSIDQDRFDVRGIATCYCATAVSVNIPGAVARVSKGNGLARNVSFVSNSNNAMRVTVKLVLITKPTISNGCPSIEHLDCFDMEGAGRVLDVDRIVCAARGQGSGRRVGVSIQSRCVKRHAVCRYRANVRRANSAKRCGGRPSIAVISCGKGRAFAGCGILRQSVIANAPNDGELLLVDRKGLLHRGEGVIVVVEAGIGARGNVAYRQAVLCGVHTGKGEGSANCNRACYGSAVHQQSGNGRISRKGVSEHQLFARDQSGDLKGRALRLTVVLKGSGAAKREGQALLGNRPTCAERRFARPFVVTCRSARKRLAQSSFVIAHLGVRCGKDDLVAIDRAGNAGRKRSRRRKHQRVAALDAFDRKDLTLRLTAVNTGVIQGVRADDAEFSLRDRNGLRTTRSAKRQGLVVIACGNDDLHVVGADVHRRRRRVIAGISRAGIVVSLGDRDHRAIRILRARAVSVRHAQSVRRSVIDHGIRVTNGNTRDGRFCDIPIMRSVGDHVVAASRTAEGRRSGVTTRIDAGVVGEDKLNVRRIIRINLARSRFARHAGLIDRSGTRLGLIGIGERRIIPSYRNGLRVDRPRGSLSGDGIVAVGHRSNGHGVGVRIRRGEGRALRPCNAGRLRGRKVRGSDVRTREGQGYGFARNDVGNGQGRTNLRRRLIGQGVRSRGQRYRNGSLRDRTDRDILALQDAALATQGVIGVDDRNGHRLVRADARRSVHRRSGEVVAGDHVVKGDRARKGRCAVVDLGIDRRHGDRSRSDLVSVGICRHRVVGVIHAGDGDRVVADVRRCVALATRNVVRFDLDIGAARDGNGHIVACHDAADLEGHTVRGVVVGVNAGAARSIARRYGKRLGRDLNLRRRVGNDVVVVCAFHGHAVRADVRGRSSIRARGNAERQLVAVRLAVQSVARAGSFGLPSGSHRARRAVISGGEGRIAARRVRRRPSQRNALLTDHHTLLRRSGQSVVIRRIGRVVVDARKFKRIGARSGRRLEVVHGAVGRNVGHSAAVGVIEGQAFARHQSGDRYAKDVVRRAVVGEVRRRSDRHGDFPRGDGAESVSVRLRVAAVHAVHAVVRIDDRNGHGLAGADVSVVIHSRFGESVARANAREGDRAGHRRVAVVALGCDRRHRNTLGDDGEVLRGSRDGVVAAVFTREIVRRNGNGVVAYRRRGIGGGARRGAGQSDIATGETGVRGVDSDLVACDHVRNGEGHTLCRTVISEGGLVGEGRSDRALVDGKSCRRVGDSVIAVRGRNGHGVRRSACVLAGVSAALHVEGKGVAHVNARVGAACRYAGVSSRRRHRPSVAVVGDHEVGRRTTRRVGRSGIVLSRPSKSHALRIDRKACFRIAAKRVVARVRTGEAACRHGISACACVHSGKVVAAVRDRVNGQGVTDRHGIAVDHAADRDRNALRRLLVGIDRVVVGPRDRNGPCGDIRRSRAARRVATIGADGVVCVGEGVAYRLIRADILIRKAAGQAEVNDRIVARKRRRGEDYVGGAVVFLIRRSDRDRFGLDRKSRGGIARQRVVCIVHTEDGHGVSPRIGCGEACRTAHRGGQVQIVTRHAVVRGGDRHVVAADYVGRSKSDGVRRLVVNHSRRARKGNGDGPCRDGPSCGGGFDLVVCAKVLRRHADAVVANVGRAVGHRLRLSSAGRSGRRKVRDGNVCSAKHDRNAVARIDAGNDHVHAVRDLVVHHAARIVSKGKGRAACVVSGEGQADRRAFNGPSVATANGDRVVRSPVAGSACDQRCGSGIVARSDLGVVQDREIHVRSVVCVNLARGFGACRSRLVKGCANALRRRLIDAGKAGRIGPSYRNVLCGDVPFAGSGATDQGVVAGRRTGDGHRGRISTDVDRLAVRQAAARRSKGNELRENGIARNDVGKRQGRAVLLRRIVNHVSGRPSDRIDGDLTRGDRVGLTTRCKHVSRIGFIRIACGDVRGIIAYVRLHVVRKQSAVVRAVNAKARGPAGDHIRREHITVVISSRAVCFGGSRRCGKRPSRTVVSRGEAGSNGRIAIRHRPIVCAQRLPRDRNVIGQRKTAQIVVGHLAAI